ncbi:MAG: glucosyl-3-phosphoglycerate synthase [Actinobacteria bacterium]|nr:glucosyl-3-phosphoglycerate synthase [Actinomycetota bacterium]MBU1943322.1 glucosyl-3-phosphoglycerate synthase [Actinomycetota bacterium]MBU2686560.1 glucosyl-3-phosphoglycerate synthase [Actinomycetota bacterium]
MDDWFAKRTYRHHDFADIERLVELKRERGLTVSVCLPTLNTADTVGPILRTFRTELVERFPLIDQLAVIDSHSTDGTIEICEAEGGQVFFDDELAPEVEPATGKGEALWKSLFVLEGDIICWVDSDIENIHPRFAYGLIGPLLTDPDIAYVKAFYERPIKSEGVLHPGGGGRVTELTVRPILNLFYPDLAGFIQPLSGEYAGRREVLQSVPFFTGYGVETGLLLDIYGRYGLDSLAQVDLEVRIHHNQPLPSLSKMSFGIMQAVFSRLESDGKLALNAEPRTVYNTIERTDGDYAIRQVPVSVVERPPALTMSSYEKRGE